MNDISTTAALVAALAGFFVGYLIKPKAAAAPTIQFVVKKNVAQTGRFHESKYLDITVATYRLLNFTIEAAAALTQELPNQYQLAQPMMAQFQRRIQEITEQLLMSVERGQTIRPEIHGFYIHLLTNAQIELLVLSELIDEARTPIGALDLLQEAKMVSLAQSEHHLFRQNRQN